MSSGNQNHKFVLDPTKISIGTANFHKNYGAISNYRVSLKEISKIDRLMIKNGITKIDSALSYIDFDYSNFPRTFFKERIVTSKISIDDLIRKHIWSEDGVLEVIENMLRYLGIYKFDSILIHGVSDHNSDNFNWFLNGLNKSVSVGLVSNLGVSTYTREELEPYFNKMKLDIIQIPLNPINQEFLDTVFLNRVKTLGIRIQTRSAFLQGALLTRNFRVLTQNGPFDQDSLLSWWNFLSLINENPLTSCINFVSQFDFIDEFIFGINSSKDLKEIMFCKNSTREIPWDKLELDLADYNDPRLWKS
jgi:diketogulonate reductase-like aldo/keto reductase